MLNPVTSYSTALIVLVSVVGLFLTPFDLFSLKFPLMDRPAMFLLTLITCTFYQASIPVLLTFPFSHFQLSKHLEHAHGSKKYLIFLGMLVLVPCVVLLPVLYALSSSPSSSSSSLAEPVQGTEEAVSTPSPPAVVVALNGWHAVFGGTLVAYTQTMPTHSLMFFKLFQIRIQNCNFYVAILYSLAAVLFQGHRTLLPLLEFLIGFEIAWIYLRFYEGDRSPAFAFKQFFPGPLQAFVEPLSRSTHKFFVRLKLITPSSSLLPSNALHLPTNTSAQNSMGFGDMQESERRRNLALKTLEMRLSNTTPATNASNAKKFMSTSSLPTQAERDKAASSVMDGLKPSAPPASHSLQQPTLSIKTTQPQP